MQVNDQFRDFLKTNESLFSQVTTYFQERLQLELSYSKEMERLSRKFPTDITPREGSPDTRKTAEDAVLDLLEYHQVCCSEKTHFIDSLQKLTETLTNAKKNQEVYVKQLRDQVKPVAKYHHELSTISVPKAKSVYYKKADNETTDASKQYKIQKEVEALEHAYKVGIVHLEDARQQLEVVRKQSKAV